MLFSCTILKPIILNQWNTVWNTILPLYELQMHSFTAKQQENFDESLDAYFTSSRVLSNYITTGFVCCILLALWLSGGLAWVLVDEGWVLLVITLRDDVCQLHFISAVFKIIFTRLALWGGNIYQTIAELVQSAAKCLQNMKFSRICVLCVVCVCVCVCAHVCARVCTSI